MAQKNGHPLSLQLSYNIENATRRAIAVQMQAELKATPLTPPQSYPANLMFATRLFKCAILTNAKYDLKISGCTAGL